MPPEPDASVRPVVAPMLPETAIVPVLASEIAILVAVTGPVTDRLPVLPLSTSEKSPPVTAKLPSDATLFAVPARATVPVTPDVLCNTALATIVPVATCVTPPPVAERSTVAPDRISPVFS